MSFENHVLYEDRPVETTRTYRDSERQQLEHSLATTFVELQDERNPEKRQKLWFECLRLGVEWRRLNGKSE